MRGAWHEHGIHTAEEIIGQVRTIEIERGNGLAMVEAWRTLGSRHRPTRLKGLEQEHARRKCWVADLSLDTRIVKEGAAGNVYARPDAEKRCAMRRRRARFQNAGRVEWWGDAGPPLSMCPPTLRARNDCGHRSSRWPTSMAATGTRRITAL